MSRLASEESGKVAEVEIASGPVVEPVVEPAAGPVGPGESAEHASPPTPTDSATSRSSLPYCTGSQPRSCTSAATASAEPWLVVAGAARHQHPVAEAASVIAKSVGCSR